MKLNCILSLIIIIQLFMILGLHGLYKGCDASRDTALNGWIGAVDVANEWKRLYDSKP